MMGQLHWGEVRSEGPTGEAGNWKSPLQEQMSPEQGRESFPKEHHPSVSPEAGTELWTLGEGLHLPLTQMKCLYPRG